MEQKHNTTPQKSKEIDIIGIVNKVLKEKKLLLFFTGVAAVVGLIVALNTPKSYTSNVVLAPEISGAGSMADNLSDLASMVGVNLSSKGAAVDAIYPEIYPDVMASSDFIIKLFDVKVRQQKDPTQKTYYAHLTQDAKIPFWDYPMIWLSLWLQKSDQTGAKGKAINPFQLTKDQFGVCSMIRSNISCSVDKKTSVITISVKDFDPMVAAIIADTLQSRLQQYITLYRTKKARNDLAYTQQLFSEAKANYVKARERYSSYADANEDLVLESFKAKRDEMENDMQLRYNMYSQLAQQLQMAKAKVQERTPAYNIIQGASVPLRASSTPRLYILLMYIFLGVLADVLWVTYLRDKMRKRQRKQ